MKIWRLAFAILAPYSIASCGSDNDNEDKVEQVTVYVSAETGTYTPLFSDEPVEGMQIQEKGSTRWKCVHFATITGFTHERGNEYELLVKKQHLPILRKLMSTSGSNSSASSHKERLNNH